MATFYIMLLATGPACVNPGMILQTNCHSHFMLGLEVVIGSRNKVLDIYSGYCFDVYD